MRYPLTDELLESTEYSKVVPHKARLSAGFNYQQKIE